jgi:ATP phosphoribosyltransferase regulatory subunit
MDLFKSEGYSEVITPSLEFYDVFSDFPQESMYKLTDAKGRLMVIRPDSTIPIIRLAETRLKNEPRPLKLCYNQTVYNVNPKDAGRDDEIAQCGVELIEESPHGVLELAVKAFKAINLDFRFEIGNCSIFESLAAANKLESDEKEKIRHFVETKNYPELSAMSVPQEFVELPKLFGGSEVFEKVNQTSLAEYFKETLEALKIKYADLCDMVGADKITVDLGLTNTRGYYTGTLFNGYTEGFGKPVLAGGMYKISDTVAAGFAVDVSAVARLRGRKS